jgi:hypothetical protein
LGIPILQKERGAVIDIDVQYRADAKQYYTFDLLTPQQYYGWIADLKKGKL